MCVSRQANAFTGACFKRTWCGICFLFSYVQSILARMKQERKAKEKADEEERGRQAVEQMSQNKRVGGKRVPNATLRTKALDYYLSHQCIALHCCSNCSRDNLGSRNCQLNDSPTKKHPMIRAHRPSDPSITYFLSLQ